MSARLLIAAAAYPLVDGEHLRGVANGLADLRSRRFRNRGSRLHRFGWRAWATFPLLS